jgi:hypothetical protein
VNKYAKTLELAHNVVGVDSTNVAEIHARCDTLLAFIYENFVEPAVSKYAGAVEVTPEIKSKIDSELEECLKLLCNTPVEEMLAQLKSTSPSLSDSVFPIAVAKFLVNVSNVKIDHCDLKNFKEYHRRYGTLIVASMAGLVK